jgi:HSP20 family protein
MIIMSLRDLIPWSRQDNRLPISTDPQGGGDYDAYPLLSLHREVNRLFDDMFRGFGGALPGRLDPRGVWPHVELSETDSEVRIAAELPGLDEKDVELCIEEGVLTLRGEKRADVEDRDRGYSERSYGRFERRISLPQGIDREQANATFRNGVLTVRLPRTEAARKNVRRIPINGKAA